ncbi:unnamed protein product [Penicillium salamii]|uniref:Uncharacterized protein n=1 Tax=Penicillium salamii TaxID=1612424 RepID=A0A9W4NH13_9EURO|nr:unnamed protein product [Penicillium salamii]CAG7969151.1 unnamed protein product [Penicillium salamii]CAG8184977.1 unnamed protein product [Penicillium salamii]CAG8237005.1 unnamed protein product [Penicillium salamii]CAG8249350.1 unnamed protein product [Penicillium salamii]
MFSYTSRSLFGVSKHLKVPVPFRALSTPSQPTPEQNTPSKEPTTTPTPASAQATPTPSASPTPAAPTPATVAPIEAEQPSVPDVKEW